MIKAIKHTKSFKKDIKKFRHDKAKLKKLADFLRALADGKKLDSSFKDHQLKGNYIGRRECHIEPDLLLIYRTEKGILYLERFGSHSDLFK
jgi:mRNA interferase YafQ